MSAQRITALLDTLASERTLRQQRLTPIETTFQCDPYQGAPRYEALRRFVTDGDAPAILEALKQSGLRGMGGAGFPTGVKWELVRNTVSEVKYVICNADESEPGTSKDRYIMQNLPDLLLEGMALAALMVGAQKAIPLPPPRRHYPPQWHSATFWSRSGPSDFESPAVTSAAKDHFWALEDKPRPRNSTVSSTACLANRPQ